MQLKKPKPKWSMKKEREHEAGNPGPEGDEEDVPTVDKLIVESSNDTLANSNRSTFLKRLAHIQLTQETCLTKAQRLSLQKEAKAIGKQFEGGPIDPEQAKAAAGVGVMCVGGLNMYPIANPIKDYPDAFATGRCAIYCTDLYGVTLVCEIIYGWTGGIKGSPEAGRTDDIIGIIQMQFDQMDPGPT